MSRTIEGDPYDISALSVRPTHCVECGAEVPHERLVRRAITCSDEHKATRKQKLRHGRQGIAEAHCVVCGDTILPTRTRYGAITCSDEHRKLRKRIIRARAEVKRCRQCARPSTPIERAAYRRFRKLELMRPDVLYPAPYKAWLGQHEGGTPEAFAAELQENFRGQLDAGEDAPELIPLGLLDLRSKELAGGSRAGRKKKPKPQETEVQNVE